MATKPGLASRSRASRRSARVAPDGGDPAVSELDLMERSLRIERAARVRAEQAARHAKAAIATAETLREATVKAAAVQLEAGMARQERLLKKQAELKRELQVVSQICKDSEALEGESSYARQIGRLKAWLHVTSAFRPPALLALTGPSRRAARGPTGEAAVRQRGPAKVADDATQPTNTTQAQLRMLIWIRHMGLSISQLDQLEELRTLSAERGQRIRKAEAEVVAQHAGEEEQVYGAILEQVSAGVAIDDPIFEPLVTQLETLRSGGERESELMKIRMEGMRSILEAERTFLRSLSPSQEMMMADALFALRSQLDPVANPEDYRALVGTTYEPGQYAVLTRGTGEGAREPLNIGALWTDDGELTGYALHEARREVLLYLLLMEPGLGEAIVRAKALL